MSVSRLRGLLAEGRAIVMGVLNVTPDSFSDGGAFLHADAAREHAFRMLSSGADVIDIGGESTRPGAAAVSVQAEMDRVLPVIEVLRRETDACLSVDTSTPEVMSAAADLGCDLINDVRALARPGAVAAAARSGLPVCLMHMQGQPGDMQLNPVYRDVVAEVADFLAGRIGVCETAGISRDLLLIDPGFGFGKTPAHNLTLLHRLGELGVLGLPILVGLSRKSTISKIVGDSNGTAANTLLVGSVVGAVLAVWQGARIVRVHDVAETVAALKVVQAVQREGV
ncbi:MAG: dihydropteroate synthase [Proteobacteria bacterium]|jgi:dihydropteroate synthase|nr:dihydropteroate synthase [Pseudomonadota bacterium]MDA1300323.1 dihydropteroate synthase [Pseudomonadota bacterium]